MLSPDKSSSAQVESEAHSAQILTVRVGVCVCKSTKALASRPNERVQWTVRQQTYPHLHH